MGFKTVKLKWAKKLLKAKMFVVLTEKESAIAIDGADPYTFTDALALAAQSAELQMFHDSLGKLIADHQTALEKLSGEPDVQTPQGTATVERTVDAAPLAKAGKQPRPVRSKAGGKSSPKTTKVPKNVSKAK